LIRFVHWDSRPPHVRRRCTECDNTAVSGKLPSDEIP